MARALLRPRRWRRNMRVAGAVRESPTFLWREVNRRLIMGRYYLRPMISPMRPVPFLRVAATLAVVLLALIPSGCAAPAARPQDSRAFVDTIGVNVHLYYTDTAYSDFAMVKQRIAELGVRHVRDNFDPEQRQFFFDRVNNLAASDVKSTLITCPITGQDAWQVASFIADAKNTLRSSLDALEGANEPDLSSYRGWADATRVCQYWVNRLAKDWSYGAPLVSSVLGPAMGGASESHNDLDTLTDRLDAGTSHCYPGGQTPSLGNYGRTLVDCLTDTRVNSGTKPIYATETGYHDAVNCSGSGCSHPPASQRAIAIYLPRLFFEYARAGVARTFLYELVDEFPDASRSNAERNFGLFENDWSYKPSATALRNLIGLLDSPGASPRTPLGYTLTNTADPDGTGPRGPVRDLLLQKGDGSWWLALWQDSRVWDQIARLDIDNPAARVEVTLDRTASSVTRYRPTYGPGSVGGLTNVQSFSADVGDDVLLLKIAH
jgi:hypothetical protein